MKVLKVSFPLFFWLLFSQSVNGMAFNDFSGKSANLNEYIGKGKWTVVVFWSYSCGICRRETPALTQFHLKHHKKDAQVIEVSIDGAKNKHKAEVFMQESAMGFKSYIAELASLAADFYRITGEGFRGTPSFLLYNPKGELLGMQTGPVRIEALENFMAKNSS